MKRGERRRKTSMLVCWARPAVGTGGLPCSSPSPDGARSRGRPVGAGEGLSPPRPPAELCGGHRDPARRAPEGELKLRAGPAGFPWDTCDAQEPTPLLVLGPEMEKKLVATALLPLSRALGLRRVSAGLVGTRAAKLRLARGTLREASSCWRPGTNKLHTGPGLRPRRLQSKQHGSEQVHGNAQTHLEGRHAGRNRGEEIPILFFF